MSEISSSDARGIFSEVLNRAAYGKERVVLTRRGKRLAAIVPVEDLELLESLENELDAHAVQEAWAEQGTEQPTDWRKVRAKIIYR